MICDYLKNSGNLNIEWTNKTASVVPDDMAI